jgi:DNA primase
MGTFHCFGCGESGDVFAFVMKINGVDFPEALEYVAAKAGISINWKESSSSRGKGQNDIIKRSQIIDANNVAAEFFAKNLQSKEAGAARKMMIERQFEQADCEKFGVGYAPRGRDNLVRHLSEKGFSRAVLEAAGLVSNTSSGLFDRFQGRVIWPIRDVNSDVLGFGARKLYDDDFFDAKYLNTSETRVYKKSKVLYGIDLARKPIAQKRQVVIVEGYTDVMAMHLAGVDTAVASCGTVFGSEHAQIVRRLMGDMDASNMIMSGIANLHQPGKIIFTFDGDEAGLKAAIKAFNEDQNFITQTYVAIVPDGLDPCDLRAQKGDLALRNLVENPTPMFEFIIKTIVSNFDISSPEGRVGALRAAAPIVAGIRDIALRPEYARLLSGWVALDISTTQREVASAASKVKSMNPDQFNTTSSIPTLRAMRDHQEYTPQEHIPQEGHPESDPHVARPRKPKTDIEVQVEMNLIAAALQYPNLLDPDAFLELDVTNFKHPLLRSVFEKIVDLGGIDVGTVMSGSAWLAMIAEDMNQKAKASLSKLSTIALPVANEREIGKYTSDLIDRVLSQAKSRQSSELRAKLATLDKSSPEYESTYNDIIKLSA